MPDADLKSRHAALVAEIRRHDAAYPGPAAPRTADAESAARRRRLDEMEAAHPELGKAGEVGAAPSEKFAKVRHRVPMLSLGNIFEDGGVADFVARVRRFLGLREEMDLVVTAEPKIDGLSCALRYERG